MVADQPPAYQRMRASNQQTGKELPADTQGKLSDEIIRYKIIAMKLSAINWNLTKNDAFLVYDMPNYKLRIET